MTGDEYDSDDDDAKTIYHDETILDESDDEGAFQSQAWEPMKFLPGAEESESTRFQLQKLPDETVFQSFPPPQNGQHWDQQETWFVLYANCMYIQFTICLYVHTICFLSVAYQCNDITKTELFLSLITFDTSQYWYESVQLNFQDAHG